MFFHDLPNMIHVLRCWFLIPYCMFNQCTKNTAGPLVEVNEASAPQLSRRKRLLTASFASMDHNVHYSVRLRLPQHNDVRFQPVPRRALDVLVQGVVENVLVRECGSCSGKHWNLAMGPGSLSYSKYKHPIKTPKFGQNIHGKQNLLLSLKLYAVRYSDIAL